MKPPRISPAVLRIVDANINRACEGLRVCEDLVRFAFGPASQAHQLRRLRHQVMERAGRLPVTSLELVCARDSRRDPGRQASATAVSSLERLLLINLQRAKEALRVLEESSRLLAPDQTPGFQRLRFALYDVERHLLLRVAALRHR